MPYDRYECDRCAACCKFPIVEIDEIDVAREPKLATAARPCRGFAGAVYQDDDGNDIQPLAPAFIHGGLLAAGPNHPCPLLGGDNLCTIYATRPNCCVAFQAGTELCQEAREAHGLPPLEPVERGVVLAPILTPTPA